MSLLSRLANVFRADRLNREIDEELQAHLDEAIASGRDPEEARRALGSSLRYREAGHRVRVAGWLESLVADLHFGWRQLRRNKVTSIAAALSLALAMGSCVGAFRLIDALLWRPLPVAHADHLYSLSRSGFGFNGAFQTFDGWAYPDFKLMRDAAGDRAQLIAVSLALRHDITYGSDQETEKAHAQYVSGSMFNTFGIKPALGRLFTEADDNAPHSAPYAVLSYDYWANRFGKDPSVLGRTFRMGKDTFQIIGVADKPFTGTSPGVVTAIFLPVCMSDGFTEPNATWLNTLLLARPGVALEPLRQELEAVSRAFETNRLKGVRNAPRKLLDRFLNQHLNLEPASSGVSRMQSEYRKALQMIGILVAMVLLIACANVANLMTAQGAARAQELALRVSIGAGRSRLVQLILVQSGLLAFAAAILGAFFAAWAAPFVVARINPPDDPARLVLAADARVFCFGLALIVGVILLFGVLPALRASAVRPAMALKGSGSPHAGRRMMFGMIAMQVAFCFLVLFVSSLFVASFQRLANRPLGFSPDRLLLLETVAQNPQPPVVWDQMAERLSDTGGVDKVALCGWSLLTGGAWNSYVSLNGGPPGSILAFGLTVSPGWLDVMKIPLLAGRDLRSNDTSPGQALVNQTFVNTFFNGENPVGKSYGMWGHTYQIVGVVADAPYRDLRESILPVAYVPFHETADTPGLPLQAEEQATFVVRTLGQDPLALAGTLRRKITDAHAGLRVSNISTEDEAVRDKTIRERLVAMLALFFTGVALLLAAIGLYGVLNYSVLQRRREIAIRMAVGSPRSAIARLVSRDIFAMVVLGAGAGVLLGLQLARYVEPLFYKVRSTDPSMLGLPAGAIIATAVVAVLPAVLRALHTDPTEILRTE
ncbi:FtsX-like permease family protein [Acidobacteria bacterium AB60]|nr:FtsX-like permease family protein [Acidobacteria bacterium AB60]